MSELEPGHEAIAASLTRRLHGYAQGLDLDDRAVRQIVEAVIVAMPGAEGRRLLEQDAGRLDAARRGAADHQRTAVVDAQGAVLRMHAEELRCPDLLTKPGERPISGLLSRLLYQQQEPTPLRRILNAAVCVQ